VDHYSELAFEHIVGYMRHRATSPAGQMDPVGDLNLKLAKKVRRRTMSDHTEVLAQMADGFFAMPTAPLRYSPQIENAEFASGITAGRTIIPCPLPPPNRPRLVRTVEPELQHLTHLSRIGLALRRLHHLAN